jgi:tetratricopeptide (TPR) repeat protein
MILELLAAAAISTSAPGPAAGSASGAGPVQAAPAKSIDDLWSQLGAAIEANDASGALALTKLIADHPDLAREPLGRRQIIGDLLGLLYAGEGQYATALPYLIESSEREGASASTWFTRIGVHAATDDLTAAARALVTLLDRRPEVVDDLSIEIVVQLEANRDVDPEAAFALRSALRDVGWRAPRDSGVWIRLIDDLLKRDRLADATTLVERVTSSGGLLQLHAMRRYDALRAAAAVPELDIASILDAELEAQRIEAVAPGSSYEARVAYASTLHNRGRFDEALAFADATLALPAPESGSDDDRALTWVMDTRARVLVDLGRIEEAVVQMQAAAKRDEGSRGNVSQTINLGWFYLRTGDNARAIATVKTLAPDSASEYGVMQAMHVRACAAEAMGDQATAAPAFAHMERNWRHAPLTWVEAQACRGDADGAADTLLLILADEGLADGGVGTLHSYRIDQRATDYDRRVGEVLAAAYARPDVVAARDRVARAFTLPTTGAQF